MTNDKEKYIRTKLKRISFLKPYGALINTEEADHLLTIIDSLREELNKVKLEGGKILYKLSTLLETMEPLVKALEWRNPENDDDLVTGYVVNGEHKYIRFGDLRRLSTIAAGIKEGK